MSDATIQARVQTLIRAIEEFDDEDVTLGDFKVLDRGSSPYAVILPGPFSQEWLTHDGKVRITWSVGIDVAERFLNDSYAPIVSARQLVKDQLDQYPKLNGLTGVKRAQVTEGAGLRYLYPRGGGEIPQFVIAPLTLTVVEITTITIQE